MLAILPSVLLKFLLWSMGVFGCMNFLKKREAFWRNLAVLIDQNSYISVWSNNCLKELYGPKKLFFKKLFLLAF